MPKCSIEILAPAWKELLEIADYHLIKVGKNSAKKITDKILLTGNYGLSDTAKVTIVKP